MMTQEELKSKLLSRTEVQCDGCWIWLGARGANGYGVVSYNRKLISTHRASWLAHNGSLPADLCVLHTCDNRGCINPEHLFLGTYQDNHDDMHRKGRGNCRNGAKLTFKQADEIRYLLKEGSLSQYKIAQIYGVSRSAILQLHLGLSYNQP